jgi:hypothetical protein
MHQEVEFIAEDIMVEVTPNFASPTQREVKVLLFKNISSFEAQSRKHIPLWLALSLKKRSKCSIAIPDWLKTENLDAILKAEQREKELQVYRSRIEARKTLIISKRKFIFITSKLHIRYASMPVTTYQTGVRFTISWKV